MNLACLLHRHARRDGTRVALIHGEHRLTYAELSRRVARLAAHLAGQGVRPGDRVGVLQRNGIPLLESLFACFHGGFAAVPVNARSTPHEVAVIADDSGAAAWLITPDFEEHAAGLANVTVVDSPGEPASTDSAAGATAAPEPVTVASIDPAWIFYTSGTTGRPKGAVLSHGNLLSMIAAYLADVRQLDERSMVLHAAPLTHGSGLYALPAVAKGCGQLITASRSYDPAEVLRLIETERVTDIAFLAPTMVNRLVREQQRQPRDISALVNVVYGGAPMYPSDISRAMDVFGEVFTQIYGQAEAPVTITTLSRAAHGRAHAQAPEILATVGYAYTTMQIGVRDDGGTVRAEGDGEIVVRGDVVMTGYWRDPDATAAAIQQGWLGTGDLGRIHPSGLVRLLDRDKDVIITGGANVYPREVEEVILLHPAVREVAVIGAPDNEWGERVLAVVVPDPDAAATDTLAADLEKLCRERLSGYKIPRSIEWTSALPKSPYGKVLKRELRNRYWSGRDRVI